VGLIADLGPGAVAVDTAIFIYFIEEHPAYLPLVLPLFEEADQGKRTLCTSALTLLEVLVVPYGRLDVRLAQHYERLLTRSRGVKLVESTREQTRVAAQLRALTAVKTPDALQFACAAVSGCRTFLTNDRALPDLPDLRVVQLSTYVS
jgi:predicted nucleic acid-binding protein